MSCLAKNSWILSFITTSLQALVSTIQVALYFWALSEMVSLKILHLATNRQRQRRNSSVDRSSTNLMRMALMVKQVNKQTHTFLSTIWPVTLGNSFLFASLVYQQTSVPKQSLLVV